jgi:hypothetical protein
MCASFTAKGGARNVLRLLFFCIKVDALLIGVNLNMMGRK